MYQNIQYICFLKLFEVTPILFLQHDIIHREDNKEGTQSKGMLYMQAHGSWQDPRPESLLGLRAGYAHHTRSTLVERRASRGACLWGLAAFICVMIWDLMFFLPLTKLQISVCDTKIRMGY